MDYNERRLLIGLRIRNSRKEKGYTQEQLCGSIGIDISGYSSIENGRSYPRTDTLCDIMSFLKMKPEELFDFIEAENSNIELTDSLFYEQIKGLSKKNKQKVLDFIKLIKK